MYALANRDIELSCDECVVRILGEKEKSAYALALLDMEESKSGFSPLYNSFSKLAIEERIVSIMKYKKSICYWYCSRSRCGSWSNNRVCNISHPKQYASLP